MQEMCHELYNGQFDSLQDWLGGVLKDEDDSSCLLEDVMLMSGISSSLNLQCPPVNSEHSYSLASDCSRTSSAVKTELDDCMYCWLSFLSSYCVTTRTVPNILFVFYSGRIVGRIGE